MNNLQSGTNDEIAVPPAASDRRRPDISGLITMETILIDFKNNGGVSLGEHRFSRLGKSIIIRSLRHYSMFRAPRQVSFMCPF
jgi:hypothetical protein